MAQFITEADYLVYIKDVRLQQMVEDNEQIMEDAEDTAIAVVSDALYSRYDIDAIFAATGNDRHRQVIRWVLNLTLYYLHERLPERLIPDRVLKNYDNTLQMLTDIEDGKKSTRLPELSETNEDGTTGGSLTKFRWGSRPARTH